MAKKGATFSAKSDTHNEHKHLFGSGGKSDFIINMTPEGARKLCGKYCIIAMLLVALSAMPYYICKIAEDANELQMLKTEHNETFLFLVMTSVVAAGFIGLLIFMIACVKKEVIIEKNKALFAFVAILLSAVISTLTSSDKGWAIYGYEDRAEGLFSILGYIGFFAVGMCITDKEWRRRVANTIIGIGTGNAVLGILQSIPALSKFIPSYYNFLFLGYKGYTDDAIKYAEYFNKYGAYDASYAADGLTCSPFALGAVLTIALAFALNKAAYTEKTNTRIICLVCSALMSGAAVLTQTLPAMIGAGCVLVISLVMSLVSKDGKNAVITSVIALAAAGCIVGGIVLTDNFRMSNEQIIYTDSFERLSISFNKHTDHEDSIFTTLWYDGGLVFRNHKVFGTGPDNWPQMFNEGMETDRVYNEIIDTAITRGIVGAAVYLVMIIVTLVKACRMLAAAVRGKISKEIGIALFTAFISFLFQSMVNTTSNCSTPFFYLTIGLIWSFEAVEKLNKSEN